MPQNMEDIRRDEVRENETQKNHETNNAKAGLGPWILESAAVLAIPLLLCCFTRGCKCGCNDCDKPVVEPKKDTVYVIKKDYHVGGDMINVEGDNNDVNFTKGNGNNVSSRNSGTQTWERAVRPQPKPVKKKPVIKPELKPEEQKQEEPKTYTGTLVIDVCHQNCHQNCH